MCPLFIEYRLIIKRRGTLATIAFIAGGDQVENVVFAAVCNRLNMIYMQYHVRTFPTAVLAGERVSLENLEAKTLRNRLALWERCHVIIILDHARTTAA